ncbi:TetR/AcrR family transcriptional regulator [Iamia sp. SCSIO 61187]|uniref:TetR/AcrR family transcriptional regulator n=1 Tax=Iamia sp. SCSIO 61187 TaxID=2722752 RepID=UPI001C634133|nr:TetR/AcrR family transcriptional regulator [Iamia sp. SCSIO 61187]QYG91898.1 TetR/AcrR family transcriptional regulator [Iamia sp. SCSIO 61187]
MPPAKQRTPALRDHLLRVAVDVLAREGVAGFTTRRVARAASTSPPAVYELFGDKAGLVRAVFFEGFRVLRAHLEAVPATEDPVADLTALALALRRFVADNPTIAEVMFSRPFADFDPTPDESEAGAGVRRLVVSTVRRATSTGALRGDPTDIAHGLLALALGLAAAEQAGRLGTSAASRDRRWATSLRALLTGYAAPA